MKAIEDFENICMNDDIDTPWNLVECIYPLCVDGIFSSFQNTFRKERNLGKRNDPSTKEY